MRYLRKNTAVHITVGPFLDKTDGITPEVALTVTNCKLTMTLDDDDNTAVNLILDAAATASGGDNDMVHITNDDAGFYDLELTAAQTNYNGRVMLAITDAANHCPVFHEFTILPQQVYDSMVAGSDMIQVDVEQWHNATTVVTGGASLEDLVAISNLFSLAVDASGNIGADVNKFLGTAISETEGGLVAGAVTKFFDKQTPTGTINSLPGALPGAAGGVFIAGSNAATTVATLTVSGTTTLTGAVALNSTLGIDGAVTFGSTFEVEGAVTFASLAVTGALTAGSITNNGTTTLTGAVSLGSTLGVTGATTLASLGITGALTTGSITNNGTLTQTGAVTLSSTLGVGAVTFASLAVTGALSVGTTTTLTGAVSMPAGLTVNITGTVSGNSTHNAAAVVSALGTGSTLTACATATSVTVSDKTGFSLASTGADLILKTSTFALALSDAVWDEALSGHAVVGSSGAALSAAGTAADPWSTELPGAYTAGMAGYIVGTYVDQAVSSVSSQSGSGAVTDTVTIYADDGSTPLDGAEVWITNDDGGVDGGTVVAGTLVTNSNGVVTFNLDVGDCWVHVQRGGYNYTTTYPKKMTVAAGGFTWA